VAAGLIVTISDRCMNISLVEIINALVPAKGLTERLANAHPQHADAVAEFVSEIDRITNELRASVYGVPPSA